MLIGGILGAVGGAGVGDAGARSKSTTALHEEIFDEEIGVFDGNLGVASPISCWRGSARTSWRPRASRWRLLSRRRSPIPKADASSRAQPRRRLQVLRPRFTRQARRLGNRDERKGALSSPTGPDPRRPGRIAKPISSGTTRVRISKARRTFSAPSLAPIPSLRASVPKISLCSAQLGDRSVMRRPRTGRRVRCRPSPSCRTRRSRWRRPGRLQTMRGARHAGPGQSPSSTCPRWSVSPKNSASPSRVRRPRHRPSRAARARPAHRGARRRRALRIAQAPLQRANRARKRRTRSYRRRQHRPLVTCTSSGTISSSRWSRCRPRASPTRSKSVHAHDQLDEQER